MPACQNPECGAHVTDDFVRVFGTNDGEVYACPSCASASEIFAGGAVSRITTR